MKKIFLSVFLLPCAMVLAGCDDGGNDAESAKKISGAITYIDNYDYGCDLGGRTGILGIDDDDELDDDTPLKTWSLTWVSGSTFIYSVDISGLEDGEYYVFFNMYNSTSCWVYGYYNDTPDDPYFTKDTVTVEDGAVIDIEIDVT